MNKSALSLTIFLFLIITNTVHAGDNGRKRVLFPIHHTLEREIKSVLLFEEGTMKEARDAMLEQGIVTEAHVDRIVVFNDKTYSNCKKLLIFGPTSKDERYDISMNALGLPSDFPLVYDLTSGAVIYPSLFPLVVLAPQEQNNS